MQELEPPDIHHLNAAVGWLELGNLPEAQAELDRIRDENRRHPEVLDAGWRILAQKKDWPAALKFAQLLVEIDPENPAGWINQSFSLHEMNRTQEAWNALLPAFSKFPKVAIVRYNLACYACQLGELDRAKELLDQAAKLRSKQEITQMALADSDLKPLWGFIREQWAAD